MTNSGVPNPPLSVWRERVAPGILDTVTAPATDLPLTCLIVDDNLDFLEAAKQLLTDDGITVVGFAATSDEAVDQAIALRPDVALVDVDLGSESGFAVAQRLAGLPEGGLPVILISAQSGTELAEILEARGARGFVSKTDLSGDAIRTILARRDSRG
jgi:CheY-like chemotaxis protein